MAVYYIKKTFIYVLIVLFLILGFIGLAIPFLPQAIFFAIAIILISFEVPWVEKKIEKFLQRFPEILKMYLKLKGVLEKHLR